MHMEKSIGRVLPPPEEFSIIKEQFIYKIILKRWLVAVNSISEQYKKIRETSPPSVVTQELKTFGIRFTHNTNRIEGSTLNLKNVVAILEQGVTPSDKLVEDVIETRSHMAIYEDILHESGDLTQDLILRWHLSLFQLTKPDIAGQIRQHAVRIAGSQYTPPASEFEIKNALADLFEWYEKNKAEVHPAIVAGIIHFRLASIHPFYDGNGRISRVAMNFILNHNHLPMFDIDYRTRMGYYRALERSNLHDDDPLYFLQWFFTHYIKSNRQYLQGE